MNIHQWKKELKFFLEDHPELYPDAGDIYTPKKRIEIVFLFNGHESISGKYSELEINFNSEVFILLSKKGVVTRILWEAIIGFQLISKEIKDNPKNKLHIVPLKT